MPSPFRLPPSAFRLSRGPALPNSPQPTAYSLSPRAGLTLIELLSSLTILVIIIGALAIIFNNATTLWSGSRTHTRLVMQGRAALETIGQDLRQAVANTNLPFSVGNQAAAIPFAYAQSNAWLQFCRYLSRPASAPFAFEQVNYAVTEKAGRQVLGRWTQQLVFSSITTPKEVPQPDVTTIAGSTNVVADAIVAFAVATNGPCVDIFISLLDPDDARAAAGISGDDNQKRFVERRAVRMSRRIYLPAHIPGGLP